MNILDTIFYSIGKMVCSKTYIVLVLIIVVVSYILK